MDDARRTTCRSGRTSGRTRRSGSATSPSPAPGTCCCARAAGGATARPAARPVAAAHRAGRLRGGAGGVVHWADPPADGATNPALEEWPVGVWPADPLGARRRAVERGAELVRAARRTALGRRATLFGERRPGRAVGARRRPAAARAGPARGSPTRRRPAARAPVGLGAGHAAPRPGRAGPPAAPADAAPPGAAGPPGHRVPRLAGGAVRRRPAGRPRRAARLRRRVRRARRRAGRAAGGVPGQRVGRPAAGRGRGAVRDAARRR